MPTMLESMMQAVGMRGKNGQNPNPNQQNSNGNAQPAPQNNMNPQNRPVSNPGGLQAINIAQGSGTNPNPSSMNANPNQQQNPNNQQGNNSQNAQVTNSDGGQNNNSNSQSPLDQFAKLWDNANSGNGNGNGQQPQSIFTPDTAKLNEAVKGIDFTKNIDQALVQKALSGDVQAFSQVLNQAIQGSFTQSLLAGSQIAERGMTTIRGQIESGFDGRIKKFNASDRLQSSNKNFNHPAVKPLMAAIQNQMAANFPEASPDELVQYSQQYLTEFANMMNGKGNNGNNQEDNTPVSDDNSQNSNWGAFFN